jgi:hypothetical protein
MMQNLKQKKSRQSDRVKPSSHVNGSSPHVEWTFLTNHTHVLLCLFWQPDRRLRDVASAVGITERMVQRIVAELVEARYLTIQKLGRCNRYTVAENIALRHPLEKHHAIGELLNLLRPA